MNEDLQKPPVIDLDAFLQPISEEAPSGENLRYSGLYDEIIEARRADDPLALGDWATTLKTADYRKVIEIATNALINKTKDLQVAAWLTESLIREHGFPGLRDSMRLLTRLQEEFWDTIHPEIDEGDMEGRGNAIEWFETQAAESIKHLKITQGAGLSFYNQEDAKIFDFPEDFSSLDSDEQARLNELKERAEKENRTTALQWRQARNLTRRQFCEELNFAIEECWETFAELNRVIEEKFDRNQTPGTANLKKSLEDVHGLVKKILDVKRAEEPDPETADEAVEYGETGEGVSSGGRGRSGGAVSDRQDALRKLSEVAAFFQRTEPHSPVSYLVQRAVKWGNMPLDSWLSEVVKDEAVLSNIKETLGLGTGSGWDNYDSSSSSDSGYDEYSSESSDSSGDSW
ncbi:type VI secretion system protein TssA [Leptolyngbya sp. 7M]|uniref:type VI secretion system protein TssA n=1 Tax=Leptolyngbya sp. 7M TaxID=2812896 RepID=UPI001B8CF711|nr:type VI secretion system protein TssA [Leptolyngbya sp. 7M]QYO65267.1 type VI secretion system protein TssA [Leptolyngbya sp. 7M]